MLTEDTEVLDPGVWELELHGGRVRRRESGETTLATELTARLARGIAENLHLHVELPYLREVTEGAVVTGRGDATVSLKWRFYDSDGLSLALKPDLLLPSGRDELGLGAGDVRWGLNVLAGYERGTVEFLGHLGYLHNRNRIGEREELWHVSAALRWTVTPALKLIVDLGIDSDTDPAAHTPSRELVYGLTYALRENLDLGIGVTRGLNEEADDRGLRAGVKLRW